MNNIHAHWIWIPFFVEGCLSYQQNPLHVIHITLKAFFKSLIHNRSNKNAYFTLSSMILQIPTYPDWKNAFSGFKHETGNIKVFKCSIKMTVTSCSNFVCNTHLHNKIPAARISLDQYIHHVFSCFVCDEIWVLINCRLKVDFRSKSKDSIFICTA